jgi:hypothetical protein
VAERTWIFDLAFLLYHRLTWLKDAKRDGLSDAERQMLADRAALYDTCSHRPLGGELAAALPSRMADLYLVAEACYLIRTASA